MEHEDDFIERLSSGSAFIELSPEDCLKLDTILAHWPLSMSKIVGERKRLGRSPYLEKRKKLKRIQSFNEGLKKSDGSNRQSLPRVEAEKDESPNIFRKDTETWTLRFNGGEVKKGVKNGMALADIQYLFQHQNEEIEILSLPNNLGMKPRAESVPIATQDDYDDLKEQINKCQERKEYETDQDVRNDCEQMICDLQKQQSQNFEKYGRPRQLAGDLTKIIRATKGRVDRFIRKLRIDDDEPILPELATHLEDFLKIDEVCIYHPETAIDWDLGKSIST